MASRKSKKASALDKDFYIKEIKVLEWLANKEPQKIRFKNRFEYKVNNKLHREDGPAIEFFDGTGNQYYNHGNKITEPEFKNYRRTKLIDEMINED